MQTALLSFPGGSFLSSNMERTSDGILTINQMNKLLDAAYASGRFIKYNAYSFYQLVAKVNREFCYSLERYIFFEKQFVATSDASAKENAVKMLTAADDLITCINYLERIQMAGGETNMVTPTKSQKPLSSVEGMQDLTLRKEMVEYSVEKNKAATNMLALYGFLNLTAIGLLIYIYRSK